MTRVNMIIRESKGAYWRIMATCIMTCIIAIKYLRIYCPLSVIMSILLYFLGVCAKLISRPTRPATNTNRVIYILRAYDTPVQILKYIGIPIRLYLCTYCVFKRAMSGISARHRNGANWTRKNNTVSSHLGIIVYMPYAKYIDIYINRIHYTYSLYVYYTLYTMV